MYSFDKFKQTELPKRDEFYSILNDEHVYDEQYKRAKTVLRGF